MFKLNQKGGLDPLVIILLFIVLALGGYVAYTFLSVDNEASVSVENVQDRPEETAEPYQDFNSYLLSLEPDTEDINELYYGNSGQYEYEKDRVFSNCVDEGKSEGYSDAEANSMCICSVEKGVEHFGGIVKFTSILNTPNDEATYEWSNEAHEYCAANV